MQQGVRSTMHSQTPSLECCSGSVQWMQLVAGVSMWLGATQHYSPDSRQGGSSLPAQGVGPLTASAALSAAATCHLQVMALVILLLGCAGVLSDLLHHLLKLVRSCIAQHWFQVSTNQHFTQATCQCAHNRRSCSQVSFGEPVVVQSMPLPPFLS
jgi:hypothetical protein